MSKPMVCDHGISELEEVNQSHTLLGGDLAREAKGVEVCVLCAS